MDKIIKLSISKFIDTKFRDYAIYVLQQRGIPSFYDALTPVQRYILMNSPQNFTKTLSVTGDCIKAGYHHGDCVSHCTSISLVDGTQVTIGEWAEKFPDAKLIVSSKNEFNEEVRAIGHSPRIGYITDTYYEIELENGEIIKCTKNHPFYVNGEWVNAEDLKENYNLFSLNKNSILIKSIKKIKSDVPIKFYDITVDEYNNFFIGNSKVCCHNSSITKAICKLTRPFGSALQLLEGYGFFGSEVCPEPAAARYTSVKISTKANEILKKYKYLITKEEEGPYNTFWLDIPIGLLTSIIGISVGYKSTILPRKLEDIQKYLEGSIKTIKPYFRNFEGTIKKYNNLKNAWIISSNIKINGNKIEIKEIPPILKYSKAINRLDYLFNKFEGKIKVLNNSNTKVNIDIVYLGKSKEEWEEIQQFIYKVFSIIVTECPIFIKDNQTLVYDTVEQYLDDYKWQLKRLEYYKNSYEKDFINEEISFNEAKRKFIKFILDKKRTIKEIDEYLKSYEEDIKDRLERMTSKKFTDDELKFIDIEIKNLKNQLKEKEKEYKISKEIFEKEIDPTLKRGITSKKNTIDLFETIEAEEDNGINIWNGTDVFEKENETLDIE